MRKFLALTVITAGLLALNQVFWTHQPQNREDRLADMTRILTGPAGSVEPQSASPKSRDVSVAAPSPQPAAIAPVAIDLNRVPDQTGALPAASTPAPVAAAQAPPVSPWQTAIAADPAVQASAASNQPAEAAPRTQDMTQRELILAIQSELKRVRCYDGATDGSWGAKSKQALQRFIERANASLPIREPDIVHLSLLQAQRGAVCGTCPKGQSLDGNGSCVPNAILAKASLTSRMAETSKPGWDAAVSSDTNEPGTAQARVAAAPDRSELWGRMSVGGPVPSDGDGNSGKSPRSNSQPSSAALAALEPDGRSMDDAQDNEPSVATLDSTGESDPNNGLQGDDAGSYRDGALSSVDRDVRQAASPRPRASMRISSPRPARAVKVRANNRSRDNVSARYRSRGVRSVQNLFMHPLGRM